MVHNHYGSAVPSGENRVFELERDMLRRNGHEVETLERFSDTLLKRGTMGTLAGAIMTPWNPMTARAIAEIAERFRPDIVHAHNTFPMLSPSIFSAVECAGRVLTLHNYRLVCPAAIPMRGGQVCTKCIDTRSVWPAIRHGCYRSSYAATLPLALKVGFNRLRGTWQRDVERFITLTSFQRETMIRAGLPADKIAIKPNFYPGEPRARPLSERPNRAVFVGRLSQEKGVKDLLDAWLQWGETAPELRIVGDGPLRAQLQESVANSRLISFLGHVESAEAEREIAMARMVILPSRCFEGFPMVLREAFALGTPVAVSDIGPLPDLVDELDGVVFRSGAPEDLFERVSAAWNGAQRLESMASKSREVFSANYSEIKNYEKLVEIYEQALRARRDGERIS